MCFSWTRGNPPPNLHKHNAQSLLTLCYIISDRCFLLLSGASRPVCKLQSICILSFVFLDMFCYNIKFRTNPAHNQCVIDAYVPLVLHSFRLGTRKFWLVDIWLTTALHFRCQLGKNGCQWDKETVNFPPGRKPKTACISICWSSK